MTTTKLILTTSDSGAGHLKQAGAADRVIALTPRLVWGAAPTVADEADFPAARKAMSRAPGEGWAYWDAWEEADAAEDDPTIDPLQGREVWAELIDFAAGYDAIEFWIDPTLDAQLIALQLLSWWSRHPALTEKLALVHADTPIGAQAAGAWTRLQPRRPVGRAPLDLAVTGWRPFRSPTPESWAALLDQDLAALPHLGRTVREWLEELPDVRTALGATEATLLALVGPDGAHPFDVFPGHRKPNPRRVFGYWEVGLMLDRLAAGRAPALLGLREGPFTLALHDEPARFDRYRASRLTLSDLGRRLVDGRDDLSRHADIDRWWGGVRLANDRLWRWDPGDGRLIPPS